jgi:hypothetical protein
MIDKTHDLPLFLEASDLFTNIYKQWRIQGFSKRGPDRGIDCYDVILKKKEKKWR